MKKLLHTVRWVLDAKDGTSASINTLLSKFSILAVNVFTGAITARLLGPTGRGELLAITLWPQFLAGTCTLGLPAALLYLLKQKPERKTELYTTTIFLGFLVGSIAALVGVLAIPTWLSQSSSEVISVTQCFMILVPFGVMGLVAISPMQALGLFSNVNQIAQMQALSTVLALLVLYSLNSINPVTASIAYSLPMITGFAYTSYCVSRHIQLNVIVRIKTSLEVLKCSIKFYGVDLLNTLANQATQVLATSLLLPSISGLYAIAFSLSRLPITLQISVATVLVSKISARPADEVRIRVARATRITLLPTFLACLLLVFTAGLVLSLIYGNEFRNAEHIFQVLVIEAFFSGICALLMQAFLAIGRPEVLSFSQLIGFIVNVALIVVLTPSYAVMGLSISLLVSTICRLVLILISFPLYLNLPIPDLIPGRQDFLDVSSMLRKEAV
jgi:O-antigen/teichoic acid export membrane protein